MTQLEVNMVEDSDNAHYVPDWDYMALMMHQYNDRTRPMARQLIIFEYGNSPEVIALLDEIDAQEIAERDADIAEIQARRKAEAEQALRDYIQAEAEKIAAGQLSTTLQNRPG